MNASYHHQSLTTSSSLRELLQEIASLPCWLAFPPSYHHTHSENHTEQLTLLVVK